MIITIIGILFIIDASIVNKLIIAIMFAIENSILVKILAHFFPI